MSPRARNSSVSAAGAVTDAVLEATLPPEVEWTGRYSVSNGEAIDWLRDIEEAPAAALSPSLDTLERPSSALALVLVQCV